MKEDVLCKEASGSWRMISGLAAVAVALMTAVIEVWRDCAFWHIALDALSAGVLAGSLLWLWAVARPNIGAIRFAINRRSGTMKGYGASASRCCFWAAAFMILIGIAVATVPEWRPATEAMVIQGALCGLGGVICMIDGEFSAATIASVLEWLVSFKMIHGHKGLTVGLTFAATLALLPVLGLIPDRSAMPRYLR